MNIILRSGVSNIHRNMSSMSGVVENGIRSKLSTLLEAKHVDVINESYMHNVPKGAETHFKVVVVSDKFEGLPLIKRHRLVNDILKEELQTSVHALSLVAKTPKQWAESDKVVESSPNCRGGFVTSSMSNTCQDCSYNIPHNLKGCSRSSTPRRSHCGRLGKMRSVRSQCRRTERNIPSRPQCGRRGVDEQE